MVFTPESLQTEALDTVKKESRTSLYKDIEILVEDFFVQNPNIEELKFSLTDIKDKWFNHNHNIDRPFIKMVLRDEFKAVQAGMQRYTPFETDKNFINETKKSGRPYVFVNPYFKTIENDEAED